MSDTIRKPEIWHDERYERKCVAQVEDHGILTGWIRRQTMAFQRAYPDRMVRSLYFDSPSLDDLGDTLSGVGERRKVRFRWYGERTDVESGVLEIKCKRHSLGVKLSYPIVLPEPLSSLSLDALVMIIARQLPESVRPDVEHASQVVALIQYKREYFVSWDKLVRVTLDRDVRIYDQLDRTQINANIQTACPDVAVLELKYAADLDVDVRNSLEALPQRLSRFSKYSTGVQAMLGV